MREISGGDAFYLFTDQESRHQHISALYIYDPSTAKERPPRFTTILKHIADRLGSSPIFRQKLVRVPGPREARYFGGARMLLHRTRCRVSRR